MLMLFPGDIKRRLSMLGGLCFFLSAVEYMIPKPLPFIRIGLANLPLLLALDFLPFPSFFTLLLLKVSGQALITGTLFSYVFIFSLCGTLASGLVMYTLRKGAGKSRISLIGVSAAGALASNGVQLFLAYVFIFGDSVRFMAAPVLGLGIVTGTVLGYFSELFISRSRWYEGNGISGSYITEKTRSVVPEKTNDTLPAKPVRKSEDYRKAREAHFLERFSSRDLAIAGLCMIPALLFNPGTIARVFQCSFFLLLAWYTGKRINPLVTVVVIFGIVFFNLLVPYGEILFSLGPLRITSGALQGGLRRAVTLTGLLMLSRFCIRSDLKLPGLFGEITGEALRIFSVIGINAGKTKRFFSRKNWVQNLDELFIDLEQKIQNRNITPDGNIMSDSDVLSDVLPDGKFKKPGKGKITSSRLVLVLMVILAWIPLILAFN